MFESKDKGSPSGIYMVKEQGICHVDGKRRKDKHGLKGKKNCTGESRELDLIDN